MRIWLIAVLSLLLTACSSASVPTPTADIEATVQARVQATVAASPASVVSAEMKPQPVAVVPTATTEPTPAPTPAPTATIHPAPFIVVNTGAEGVYLRKTPGGEQVKAWPEKTVMYVVGHAQEAEGKQWGNVKDPDGNVGWVPYDYLVAPPQPTATPDRSRYKLELLALRGTIHDYGYVTVEGQVRNISGASIRSIQVVAEWADNNRKFIASHTGIIEFDPLLPGQTSPFKVTGRSNPEMKYFMVRFKEMLGAELPVLRSDK